MKRLKATLLIATLLTILSGCGTLGSKDSEPALTQLAMGSVTLTVDNEGKWVKITSIGVAPLNDTSAHAISESSKVAAMLAKVNITEFISTGVTADKTTDTRSTSTALSDQDNVSSRKIETVTKVVEQLRANSQAVLRGVFVTKQSSTREFTTVEVTVTRQSIVAASSLKNSFSGQN